MDIYYEDVLVVASLILVDREAEADCHQFVRGEAAGSRIGQHRASVLVGVLPAELLQQDVALLHLPALALLTLHSERLALLHHSHNFCFHTLVYFSLLVQLKLILKYSLQTVNVKYMLITLVLRRAFSRPFIINLLACHRGPREPRTDGAKVGRGEESHNRFPNISRKNPCFWEKMALFWENQGNMKLLQFQKSEKSCFSPVFSQTFPKMRGKFGKTRENQGEKSSSRCYFSVAVLLL